MKRLNNKNLPKVTLILIKGNKKKYLYPSLRKTQFFLNNKAEAYLKNGDLVTIRVSYTDDSHNSGTYNSVGDLNLAFEAFVKEYV